MRTSLLLLLLCGSTALASCSPFDLPILLRVHRPPTPTPTPYQFTGEHDPAFFAQQATATTAGGVALSQEGTAELLGRTVRLQEPIMLIFESGARASGVLDAVTPDSIQLKTTAGVAVFPRSEVAEITQF